MNMHIVMIIMALFATLAPLIASFYKGPYREQ